MKNDKNKKRVPSKKTKANKAGNKPAIRATKTNKRITPTRNEVAAAGAKITSTGKIRVNDPNTGKLIWLPYEDYFKFQNLKEKIKEKAAKKLEKEKTKRYSKLFDVRQKDVKPELYDNIDSFEKLQAYKNEFGRIRYNGQFITADAEKRIFEFAKILSREGNEWTLTELLNYPQIKNKIVIHSDRKDGMPKYRFYWALQNAIRTGKYGEPKIIIFDFNGNKVFDGFNGADATDVISKYTRIIKAVEEIVLVKEQTNPYFTIPTYETKRDGHILKFEIEFSGIESQLPRELHNKYREML